MTLLENSLNTLDGAPPARGADSWTEERIALLIKLREEGTKRRHIADIINEQTGSKFTTGAIVGKIDRLFTSANPRKTPEELEAALAARRERDREKKRLARQASPKRMTPFRRPLLAVVEFRAEEFTDANIHGMGALEPHHCRFICNSDMSAPVYCGLPIIDNTKLSWCAGHYALCTVPSRSRAA